MTAAVEIQPTGDEAALEKKLAAVDLGDLKDGTPTQSSSVAASLREIQPGIRKTPFVDPVPSAKPHTHPVLTAQQQEKYEELLEIVKSWKEIPSATEKGGSITESEIMWLSRECLLRYLRATKWKTHEAADRILGTLTWRRDNVTGVITGDHISPENETGKQIILGYDKETRPCLYLNPGRQNTQPSPRQVQHLVFMLERVIDLMGPGQETLALLINFKKSETRSNTSPPLSQGREVLHILQTHYPERLGRALIINVPWVVWGFFKLITPFIDPLTREKLKFNEDVGNYIPREQLWTEFKGDVEFDYDHDTYWPALNQLCVERASEMKARWERAGRHYGESEDYLRGGRSPSVGKTVESVANASTSVAEDGSKKTTKIPTNMKEEASEKKLEAGPDAKDVLGKSSIEAMKAEEFGDVAPLRQTHGTQAHGNTDIVALKEDTNVSTEGDRA